MKNEDDERFGKNGERKLDDLRNLNNTKKKRTIFGGKEGENVLISKRKIYFKMTEKRKSSNMKTLVGA